jgi:hypothetical protein
MSPEDHARLARTIDDAFAQVIAMFRERLDSIGEPALAAALPAAARPGTASGRPFAP